MDENETENTKKLRMKALWPLFVIFFKAGTFTFAGGLAMLPVIEKDIVEKYQFMSKDEFLEYATLAQTLPGIIAVNCACFVGKHVAGFLGELVAAIGGTFSAFVLMLLATIATQYIPAAGPAAGAMNGIRAASAALIFSAAYSLGRHNLKSAFAIIVMLSAFVMVFFLKISTPFVVLFAALSGIIYFGRIQKKKGDSEE